MRLMSQSEPYSWGSTWVGFGGTLIRFLPANHAVEAAMSGTTLPAMIANRMGCSRLVALDGEEPGNIAMPTEAEKPLANKPIVNPTAAITIAQKHKSPVAQAEILAESGFLRAIALARNPPARAGMINVLTIQIAAQ